MPPLPHHREEFPGANDSEFGGHGTPCPYCASSPVAVILLSFVSFVLLCLRFFAACANFLSQVRRCRSVIPAKAGIQVGWWCGRRVRHNFLPARRRKGWIPASAGMTENEPAFHVWLRLCRARSFLVQFDIPSLAADQPRWPYGVLYSCSSALSGCRSWTSLIYFCS